MNIEIKRIQTIQMKVQKTSFKTTKQKFRRKNSINNSEWKGLTNFLFRNGFQLVGNKARFPIANRRRNEGYSGTRSLLCLFQHDRS